MRHARKFDNKNNAHRFSYNSGFNLATAAQATVFLLFTPLAGGWIYGTVLDERKSFDRSDPVQSNDFGIQLCSRSTSQRLAVTWSSGANCDI